MAIVIITHDLGVVAEMADDIAVMYAGRMVETPRRRGIFAAPEHPYTWGLLKSIPRLDAPARRGAGADSGHASEPHQPALRLPLPPALPLCATGPCADRPATGAGARRAHPSRRMPAGGGGATAPVGAAGRGATPEQALAEADRRRRRHEHWAPPRASSSGVIDGEGRRAARSSGARAASSTFRSRAGIIVAAHDRRGQGGGRHELRDRARRDAGDRRRDRLRQEHDGAADHAAARVHRRADRASTDATSRG